MFGQVRRVVRVMSAVGLLSVLAAGSAAAEDILALSYDISLAGVHVGSADVDARFTGGGYAIALSGSVGGVSRLLSNASARMAASGNISGTRVLPAYYEIEMAENGMTAEVQMNLNSRRVMDLHVVPGLVPSFDRISLTIDHLRDVLDPMSALFIATAGRDLGGAEACGRTIRVFDGWQRFDIVMRFDTTRTIIGARDAYAGPVHICSARYVPVAGHRPSQPSVAYMETNEQLEVWLMPVAGLDVMIPYQMLVGTELGDLVIELDRLALRLGN